VAHGAPCSNCRHDEIECVLPLSRRQRYFPLSLLGLWMKEVGIGLMLTTRTIEQLATEQNKASATQPRTLKPHRNPSKKDAPQYQQLPISNPLNLNRRRISVSME
jgi:hypothetical protein